MTKLAASDVVAPPTAWERRRRMMRRDLETCALEVLAERGYDGVSTDDLAAAAGVSTRTFFRYFATKDDVVMAMPLRVAELLCAAVVERPAKESILAAFRAVATQGSDWRQIEDVRSAHLFQRMMAISPGVADRVASNGRLAAPFITAVAKRLDVDPETDLRPGIYGTAVQGALHFAMSRWVGDRGESLPALFAEALDLLAELPNAGRPPRGNGRARAPKA